MRDSWGAEGAVVDETACTLSGVVRGECVEEKAGEEEVEAVGIALAGAGPGPPSLANRFKRIYDMLVSGMDHIIARMRGILSLRRPGGSMPW